MEGDKWMEIRNDRLKGMNFTELGKKYHVDPRTAKKYAESPQRPEYTLTAPKPNKLDAFKQQIDLWLTDRFMAGRSTLLCCTDTRETCRDGFRWRI